MIKLRDLLKNRTALQTLIVLVFGFLIILVATLFVFYMFLARTHYRVSRFRISYEVERAVRLAKLIPPNRLRRHARFLDGRGLRVRYGKKPLPDATIITNMRGRQIRQFVIKNYRDLKASYQLANNDWLNIRSWVRTHPWFYTGFYISVLLLLIALFILCVWVVKRLTLPVSEFTGAAKRFGVDVQSPPMAVTGPPEVQEVIRAFNEMQERIRRLLDDRTQMLAAISHDLRTPITRLQLRAEYLKGTPQYEKAVADLKEMEKMIASILAFARDYARSEVMEKFDINALLETLCNDLVDTGQPVKFHGGDERIVILGRLSAIKRALTNLIENAVKYGKQAEVKLASNKREVQIKISDQGPGIPKAEMENVFSPFYRLDAARTPGVSGTGLGMAVARDIIRSHGGDIKLYNRKPHGLTALVTLPIK